MEETKTFLVTGATGNQGGAVARNLHSKGFKVKALVRNPASSNAKKLDDSGIQLIIGDLDEPETYSSHLQDIDGLFCVLSMNKQVKKEIKQGIEMASLALKYNVPHFIYSSVAGADANTGIPHFESKLIIESHLKQIGIPFTILRPTSLFENFLIPQVKNRILKGKLVSPINREVKQQMISSEDIGKKATEIFSSKEIFTGQTITMAAEEMDLEAAANAFSDVMNKPIVYQKLPAIITRLAMGKDMYRMFQWINKNGGLFLNDINSFKKENSELLSLESWIRLHFKQPILKN